MIKSSVFGLHKGMQFTMRKLFVKEKLVKLEDIKALYILKKDLYSFSV